MAPASSLNRSGPGIGRRALRRWRGGLALVLLALAGLIGAADTEYLLLLVIGVVFIASQIFWLRRVIDLGERLIPGRPRRYRVAILVLLTYLLLIAYSFPTTIAQGHTFRSSFERFPHIVADAAFWWWFVGSMAGFLLIMGFGAVDLLARAAGWVHRRIRRGPRPEASISDAAPRSDRREFMRKAAVLVSATPFVAAGYGLLYGREDVEIVRNRVRLAGLPEAFRGFRIAQLADIHMGPFAGAAYLRRCIAMTNELRPDVVVLTGDFIAWETGYLREAVRTLGGLHAPHGVFGCLGNHESESNTEDEIARLFAAEGIRMLRQEATPIQRADGVLNLIGIDDVAGETGTERRENLQRRLRRELVTPGVVNILLAHEPAAFIFDRAAELGVDLVLAGHTHGGQLALGSVRRGLNPARFIYRYNSGWYEKNGTQLYVNRGIGTTGFPIRLGARPEITIFELAAH